MKNIKNIYILVVIFIYLITFLFLTNLFSDQRYKLKIIGNKSSSSFLRIIDNIINEELNNSIIISDQRIIHSNSKFMYESIIKVKKNNLSKIKQKINDEFDIFLKKHKQNLEQTFPIDLKEYRNKVSHDLLENELKYLFDINLFSGIKNKSYLTLKERVLLKNKLENIYKIDYKNFTKFIVDKILYNEGGIILDNNVNNVGSKKFFLILLNNTQNHYLQKNGSHSELINNMFNFYATKNLKKNESFSKPFLYDIRFKMVKFYNLEPVLIHIFAIVVSIIFFLILRLKETKFR